MTERVNSVGSLEEGESSSVGSSVETLSEDSSLSYRMALLFNTEEVESDPRVKEEVGVSCACSAM